MLSLAPRQPARRGRPRKYTGGPMVCRFCKQEFRARDSHRLHEPDCAENPANKFHCRVCGVEVPKGATACRAHEERDSRMRELDALIRCGGRE
jgi:hypothetical protein